MKTDLNFFPSLYVLSESHVESLRKSIPTVYPYFATET